MSKRAKRILGFDVSKVSTGWACLDKNEYYYGKILIDSSLDITVSAQKIYKLTSFFKEKDCIVFVTIK